MGLARGAHGHDWGDLLFHSGGPRPGDPIYRVMAAWITRKQIPVPQWLRPVVERTHQPPVPPAQRGAYGNAALAQAANNVEASGHYWSSSDTPSRPGDFDPSKLPWQEAYPRYPSELPWWDHPRYPGLSSASIRTQSGSKTQPGPEGLQ